MKEYKYVEDKRNAGDTKGVKSNWKYGREL
jgi:hypothetical protein